MTNTNPIEASVILVSYNTRDILKACLDSLYKNIGDRNIEVVVVDNASRDASAEMVATHFPTIKLVRSPTNLGFAAANNLGFGFANGHYLILLNPDTLLEPNALSIALKHMDANPKVGMAGGLLIDRDGTQQPSARQFPSLLNELLVLSGLAARFPKSAFFGRFDRTWADPLKAAEVDWVPGAFTMIRQDALKSVGGFDERFFLYYEEVDLCRRFKNHGWKILYWPDIVVIHWGGESSKTVENVEFTSSGSQLVLWRMRSGLLYYRKHHGYITALLASRLEIYWHELRRMRAERQTQSTAIDLKAKESGRIANLMRRAWEETKGGQISPPRPW
jgi:GT2 family glycosyltransferase